MLFVFFYHKYIQFWTILNKISLYKRIRKSNYPEIKYLGKNILKYVLFCLPIFSNWISNPYSLSQHISSTLSLYTHIPQSDIDYLLNSLVVPPSHSDIVLILFLSLLFSIISTSWNSHPDITFLNDGHISMGRVRMNMNFYCLPEYSNCW